MILISLSLCVFLYKMGIIRLYLNCTLWGCKGSVICSQQMVAIVIRPQQGCPQISHMPCAAQHLSHSHWPGLCGFPGFPLLPSQLVVHRLRPGLHIWLHLLSQQVSEIWNKYLNNHYQALLQARIQQLDLLGKRFETDTGLGKWQFSHDAEQWLPVNLWALSWRGRALCLPWITCHLSHLAYGETETGDQRDFTRSEVPSIRNSFSGDRFGGKKTLPEPTMTSVEYPRLMCYPSKAHKPRQTQHRSHITHLSWCPVLFLYRTASFSVAAMSESSRHPQAQHKAECWIAVYNIIPSEIIKRQDLVCAKKTECS